MTKTALMGAFPSQEHNHRACQRQALRRAEEECARKGIRLTALRRRVLELIWDSHAPVKAYDLLDQLKGERRGAAPPTVYRALDFLVAEGFIHRIESLNAYVGCDGPDEAHQGQFLICRQCGESAELSDPDVTELLAAKAARLGFDVDQTTIELTGVCPRCRATP